MRIISDVRCTNNTGFNLWIIGRTISATLRALLLVFSMLSTLSVPWSLCQFSLSLLIDLAVVGVLLLVLSSCISIPRTCSNSKLDCRCSPGIRSEPRHVYCSSFLDWSRGPNRTRYRLPMACLILGCAPLLITEVCHPQHRARFTAIYNTTWFVGNIIATWVTFATAQDIQSTWCWRLPSLLQGIFAAFQLVGIWFVPYVPSFRYI